MELRDHAEEILTAVVQDIGAAQTSEEQALKSQGLGSLNSMQTSGTLHADDRIRHGFTFAVLLPGASDAEYVNQTDFFDADSGGADR